ncbi:MAG TPA: ABC transporter ATP-binding protein [Acidimicrobiales bacterium]|nr:ABC transporter ATP-binding protein [Acidimicrobiales bacterium]
MAAPDGAGSAPLEAAIKLSHVDAGYGGTAVLRDVSIEVLPSSVVALLGANGAGKTTTLRAAAGLLRPSKGTVSIGGVEVNRRSSHQRARLGVCLIPEGRGIFRSLTVKDNLELQIPPWHKGKTIDAAIEAFPVLGQRINQVAGSMSGGQQQMLALSRAFLADPKVVLLDEVSMGLAPIVVEEIFESLRTLAATGVSLLLVEQYVTRALDMADVAYLMARGDIVWSGPAGDLDEGAVTSAYLGHADDLSKA